MLRGRHKGGGFWFVIKRGNTRLRVDWKQRLEFDGWTVTRTTIKSWSTYPTEPIKFHFDKSWTH